MNDATVWVIFWFVFGMFVATVIFDMLWRISRKAANDLITAQREYIAELERRQ